MNQLIIMGHLGADPEVRFTQSGLKVTTLRVAENQRRGSKEETLWWRVTIWGERFDKMISYLKRGSAIIATGEMSKPEIYEDREGKPQLSLNMTANSLSFSPFGRTEKQPQEQPTTAGQTHHVEPQIGGIGSPTQEEREEPMSAGQGDPVFNDPSGEEIPF